MSDEDDEALRAQLKLVDLAKFEEMTLRVQSERFRSSLAPILRAGLEKNERDVAVFKDLVRRVLTTDGVELEDALARLSSLRAADVLREHAYWRKLELRFHETDLPPVTFVAPEGDPK